MDGKPESGHGEGDGKERDMEEATRTGILRTDGGTSMVVYPLSRLPWDRRSWW